MKKDNSFIKHVRGQGIRPVLCFYFHPWEFHEMPHGALEFGEAKVTPKKFIVKNCGDYACEEFEKLCPELSRAGARFATCREIADEY